MGKLLTIVVPAYNAESYLRDNLESLCIEEAIKDTEVIIINDGSTDRTHEIGMEFFRRFPDTVRVIDKKNGGHGSGINRGIEEASGRYFKVVDADDWVERDAYIWLLQALRAQDTDIVASGFYWVIDNRSGCKENFKRKAEFQEPFKGVQYEKKYDFDDIAEKLYIKMHSLTIRTAILKEMLKEGLRIDENCYYVDAEYILYPIPYVKTISFIKNYVYMYRIGRIGQSVSPERMRKNEANYDKVLESLLRFYDACRTGNIDCSDEKLRYIEHIVARIVAGKIKILLSYPRSKEIKSKLKTFDRELCSKYPAVYTANLNNAVKLLRMSRYELYQVATAILQLRNGRTV